MHSLARRLAKRRLLALSIVFIVVTPFCCRRAGGVAEDPLDREAEEALVSYLRIDTSNPPGHETAGARLLQQLFVREGIDAQLVGSDPQRQGVYARLRSGSPAEKALLLLHHIDVVPVIASEWTKPPFAGLRSEGYIWGRGALDCKSLGIAHAMAMIELKRRNAALRRDIVFLAVPDEEMGSLRGCKELLERHPDLFDGIGYVVNEGGYNETIVDRISIWGIEVQQKVPLWIRVKSSGPAGHGSTPPDDGGAVAKLARALAAIGQIETPYRLTPDVARHFHQIGAAKHDERGEILRSISEPLDVRRISRVLSASYRDLLRDTITPTRIGGGASPNSIPAHASADVDIRLLPDERAEPMIARVKDAVGSMGEVEVLIAGEPAPATSTENVFYRSLSAAMRNAEPHSAVVPVVGTGTSDSRFFRERGVVAYGVSPFKVNYYDVGTAHGNDERIRARFFVEGVRLMRTMVRDFCAK